MSKSNKKEVGMKGKAQRRNKAAQKRKKNKTPTKKNTTTTRKRIVFLFCRFSGGRYKADKYL